MLSLLTDDTDDEKEMHIHTYSHNCGYCALGMSGVILIDNLTSNMPTIGMCVCVCARGRQSRQPSVFYQTNVHTRII